MSGNYPKTTHTNIITVINTISIERVKKGSESCGMKYIKYIGFKVAILFLHMNNIITHLQIGDQRALAVGAKH